MGGGGGGPRGGDAAGARGGRRGGGEGERDEGVEGVVAARAHPLVVREGVVGHGDRVEAGALGGARRLRYRRGAHELGAQVDALGVEEERAPHAAGSRIEVKPEGRCGPSTSCSRTPIPSRVPRRARQTCCTWRWRGSIGSRSASVQLSPPTASSPFHRPWPHSGWR